jgi:hypothetical protein
MNQRKKESNITSSNHVSTLRDPYSNSEPPKQSMEGHEMPLDETIQQTDEKGNIDALEEKKPQKREK